MYQGEGYINTTGMDAMDVKNMYGTKANTYHWDINIGDDGWLLGHDYKNPDGDMPHLQIHPATGKEIRILFNIIRGKKK